MALDIDKPIEGSFQIIGGNFDTAGAASSQLKRQLVELGVNEEVIRHAAIATFEAEMNVITANDRPISTETLFK